MNYTQPRLDKTHNVLIIVAVASDTEILSNILKYKNHLPISIASNFYRHVVYLGRQRGNNLISRPHIILTSYGYTVHAWTASQNAPSYHATVKRNDIFVGMPQECSLLYCDILTTVVHVLSCYVTVHEKLLSYDHHQL